jgi:hypothetical protein
MQRRGFIAGLSSAPVLPLLAQRRGEIRPRAAPTAHRRPFYFGATIAFRRLTPRIVPEISERAT